MSRAVPCKQKGENISSGLLFIKAGRSQTCDVQDKKRNFCGLVDGVGSNMSVSLGKILSPNCTQRQILGVFVCVYCYLWMVVSTPSV